MTDFEIAASNDRGDRLFNLIVFFVERDLGETEDDVHHLSSAVLKLAGDLLVVFAEHPGHDAEKGLFRKTKRDGAAKGETGETDDSRDIDPVIEIVVFDKYLTRMGGGRALDFERFDRANDKWIDELDVQLEPPRRLGKSQSPDHLIHAVGGDQAHEVPAGTRDRDSLVTLLELGVKDAAPLRKEWSNCEQAVMSSTMVPYWDRIRRRDVVGQKQRDLFQSRLGQRLLDMKNQIA